MVNDWAHVLLLHLIRCPSTISRALDKVTQDDLSEFLGPHLVFMWTKSSSYYREHQKVIPQVHLEAAMCEYIQGNQLSDFDLSDIANFLSWVYSAAEDDLNMEEAVKHMRRMLGQTRVEDKIRQALIAQKSTEELYETMALGVQEAAIGGVELIDPMDLMEQLIGIGPPSPLGGNDISYFNKLCNGGLKVGEELVLIGPTGGFKTTMAIDIICSMANVAQKSLFIAYEQSAQSGDLNQRFWSRLTGIPRSAWEDPEYLNTLSADHEARIAEAKTRSGNVMWADRSQSIDQISDIAAIVQDCCHAGNRPEIVVIDQLLTWIQRWPDFKPENVRMTALRAVERLKHEVAEKYGTRLLVLHQLTADLTGKGSQYKPCLSDSAEVKGIGSWVDFVIHLGNKCKDTNCLWGIATKTRRGESSELILRADGENCRLSAAGDMEFDVHGSKRFVSAGNKNKVPGGKKSTSQTLKKNISGSSDYSL